jgi:predicted ATPase
VHRFGPQGLYILDEPEAALSVKGCMALILRMVDLVRAGSQFIVATHSPVLLAVPGAAIVQIDATGTLTRVGYDDAEPVALTRAFLSRPDRYLGELLADDE